MKPKFEMFELVRVYFNGEVAGIKVTVHRDLYVYGMTWTSQRNNHEAKLYYDLSEKIEKDYGNRGQEFKNLEESQLNKIEPVVKEIAKAVASKSVFTR